MDTSRVSLGEMLAAAGALVLLFSMFLPWFDSRLTGRGAQPVTVTASGWESFGGVFDLLVVALAAVPIAVALARAADRPPPLSVEPGMLVTAAGAGLFVIVAFRLIDPPDVIDVPIPGLDLDTTRQIPAFAALLAAALIAVGGRLQRADASAAGGIRTHKP